MQTKKGEYSHCEQKLYSNMDAKYRPKPVEWRGRQSGSLMKMKLRRIQGDVLFEAENGRGHRVRVEGTRAHGGKDAAPSPTEYLLISHMGCTAVDLVGILGKMRQPLVHLELEAEARRENDEVPHLLTEIHLHYTLYGAVKPEKAAQAIDMSIQRYCTVSKMIDKVARITTSFEILPAVKAVIVRGSANTPDEPSDGED